MFIADGILFQMRRIYL